MSTGPTIQDAGGYSSAPLLRMKSISKSFSGVRALHDVSFNLLAGEIHALVGENGAGKSTLIKILGGVYPGSSYSGEIWIEGKAQNFRQVRDAERAGVTVVHQELSLVPEMSVAENIYLGQLPSRRGVVDWNRLHADAARWLRELGLGFPPSAIAGQLGVGQQQMVEIAKALSRSARILVLDEPTAALTESETEALFTVLDRLRQTGIGIIYISHRLPEVFRLSRRITILRDGETIRTADTSALDANSLIALMVGRELSTVFPPATRTSGDVMFEARHLCAESTTVRHRRFVEDVSFAVRRGEILGIAGLMGAGRSELLMSLFGAHQGRVTGEVLLEGKPVHIADPADAIRHGIAFVTEDRKGLGLLLEQDVTSNVTLASLRQLAGRLTTDVPREREIAAQMRQELRIKAASVDEPVKNLSGGNQQKVVLAKWLLTQPKVLFLDEPTRGIDVGSRQEIYRYIDDLARRGLAIVMVSSELEEVLGMSDRIMVLHEGRVTGHFLRPEATPERIMACATGQHAVA